MLQITQKHSKTLKNTEKTIVQTVKTVKTKQRALL